MKKIETPVKDLYIIEPEVYSDERGYFYEPFNADKFKKIGIHNEFRQASQSFSRQGVLRGFHFQKSPKPMAKLVRCSSGRLWDVAVDLRSDSPTYRKWFGLELSQDNHKMLFIPAGFGHGFYALTDCVLNYLNSNTFDGTLDAGIAWDDPSIDVKWPLTASPSLSQKDQTLPLLKDIDLVW
ncbi:dTDP-4-dehydrorhamnose 3,5-epimerase [Candidatus Uhrbacteria bacterium]|jgi:dTDP-4-dehydrorhamnose 3,5-epimerase|nr:dTDP-4-dehydrorhamnose 3,5-epimerase [Candidatus Uhrbacteria bacterium]